MRRLLNILGVLFILLVAFVGIEWLHFYQSGKSLQSEVESSLDEIVPAVLSSMDKRVLLDRACTEFVEKYKEGRFLDDYFAALKRLGKFKEVQERSGIVHVKFFKSGPITADFKIRAEFETATPEFTVQLVKRRGWQVLSFMVDADTFMRLQTAPNTH